MSKRLRLLYTVMAVLVAGSLTIWLTNASTTEIAGHPTAALTCLPPKVSTLPSQTAVRAKQAVCWLEVHGLTHDQAVGVTGDLAYESAVDPAAVQVGGVARGVALWPAEGWNRFRQYADRHPDTDPLAQQLAFMVWDLQQPNHATAWSTLTHSQNAGEATLTFARDYIQPSALMLDSRTFFTDQIAQL